MVRFVLCLFMCVFVTQSAEAQLLRRVFRGGVAPQVSSSCPGGVCPVQASAYSQASPNPVVLAPFKAVAQARGHWSYPGTIDSHLEGTHGVATAGMTREQKLDMHDALHEGRAPVVSVPRAAPIQVVSNYPAQSGYTSGGSTGYSKTYSGGSTGSFSGGSTGSFAVGQMYRGEIITSIGPASSHDYETMHDYMKTPAANSATFGIGRRDFKKALLESAKQAQEEGQLSPQEYRRLSFALKIPGVAAKMEAAMQEQAMESGLYSGPAGAINWAELGAFIKEMIPVILQLIQLFSDNLQIDLDHPYVMKPITEVDVASSNSFEWYSAA